MSSLVAKCSNSRLFHSKPHLKHSSSSPSRPFEEELALGLRSLLIPHHGSRFSLSWLAGAVRLLGHILCSAAALFSNPSLPEYDDLDAHLDAGVPLLDSCNAVSAEIARVERRLLHLRLALRFLSPKEVDEEDFAPRHPTKERLRGAKKAIAKWESMSGLVTGRSAGEFIRRMAPDEPTRGHVSAVRRATFAVEAVSHLVMAAAMVVFGCGDFELLGEIKVSRNWPWAEAYNDVAAALSGGGGPAAPAELEAVEASASRLKAVMGTEEKGDRADRLTMAVKEMETATEELTAGLDGLRENVNGAFHAAMEMRNTALNRLRSRTRRCK
ncbi:hypothetical protein Cni_G07580 [Canna indica]|uniref:Uncharacterized protein n=1 Tax=Canna indica TaxID=4628 RepID=A0AAQ3JYZ5_9LILI|nr:hypothetical protein Cni_G07580 [Canna indica]